MIPSEFHFERPWWLLALLPAAILLWHLAVARSHRSGWRQSVDPHLLEHLALGGSAAGGRGPLWLLGAGWLCATLAMAGPSWERIPQPTANTLEPTVVALDMSLSMDAEDVSPSRLARARYKLQDIVARHAGGQVGLVIYSDEPFVAVPLTDDGRVIAEMIPTLTSDIMPGGGDRPDRALDQAVALLAQAGAPSGHIIVLTDSAGTDPAATRAAAVRAASDGYRVSTLGIGTEAGAPIPNGRGGFVRDSAGEVFIARLARSALEDLTVSGDGRFAAITAGDADLNRLLGGGSRGGLSSSEGFSGSEVEAWRDAGIYLLFLPLLLAPLGFRRGWLAAVVLAAALGAPGEAQASLWDDLWSTRNQQGAEALDRGDAAQASRLFESAEWSAAAQYENADYEAASLAYAGLGGIENQYNRGNALAREGKLDESVAAFEDVLREDPEHEDARFNRDLVQRLLEQEEQEQSQQDSSSERGGEPSGEEQQNQGSESGEEQQNQGSQSGEEQQNQGSQSGEEQQNRGSESGEEQQNQGSESGEEQQNQGSQSGEEQQNQGSQSGEEQQNQGSQSARVHDGDRGESGDRRAEVSQKSERGPERNSLQQPVSEALEEQQEHSRSKEGEALARSLDPEPLTEEQQAREQMLSQIPDDPSGLLRAKIHRKYAEKRYAQQRKQLLEQRGTNPWW